MTKNNRHTGKASNQIISDDSLLHTRAILFLTQFTPQAACPKGEEGAIAR
ncbi:hypothetical protein [Picosynechococcus sp. NKBG15041c]|nr:hypothetical protein [Picosynechococcus sp. NKBG15041c]